HLLFFFQAEDGIRDFHVTGVQTCALPISANLVWLILLPGTYWYYIFRGARGDYPPFADSIGIPLMTQIPFYLFLLIPLNIFMLRSEERRVGKDFRFGFMLCDVRMIYLCTF